MFFFTSFLHHGAHKKKNINSFLAESSESWRILLVYDIWPAKRKFSQSQKDNIPNTIFLKEELHLLYL